MWQRTYKKLGKQKNPKYLLMDKAYESDETRFLAQSLNFNYCVPPKFNRKAPWAFDKILYKSHNEIERLFRKIKHFRRIFTRYDKLDSLFRVNQGLSTLYGVAVENYLSTFSNVISLLVLTKYEKYDLI